MNSRLVIRALKADGWYEIRQVGSYKQYRHITKTGTVTVVHPTRDLPLKTLSSIERQSGPKLR